MNQRVQEILASATDVQREYVQKRLLGCRDPAAAARKLGLSRSTPHKWSNFEELEEAIGLLYADVIEATKLGLESLALDAVQALGRALKDGGAPSVAAARAIFDRIGLPAMSQVDVTSGGESIKAVVYIPDNGREDRD